MLAWTGGLINAVQTTMYALAAHVYPTSIRATGVGTAVAFGRIGGVLSPSLGSWALESGGASQYLPPHRRHDDGGVRGAGRRAASHSRRVVGARRGPVVAAPVGTEPDVAARRCYTPGTEVAVILPMHIGFIGFGEAGSTIAGGLRSAGVERLVRLRHQRA